MLHQRRAPASARFVVLQLRQLDWVQRHAYFDKFVKCNPKMMLEVQGVMNPDELLTGHNTGLKALPGDIVVLKDKVRKKHKYVQTTLHMWFHVKKRRTVEARLDRYFTM